MTEPVVANVLAMRYSSSQMRHVWSPARKVRIERDLWVAVLKAQHDLGLDVPEAAISAYEAVADS
ncbi:MAG: adenylosuccinate lyase, partial [Actinobacteria bacterium]|nr:adenylosuccinate lyase [Actinomycetota bacterium]